MTPGADYGPDGSNRARQAPDRAVRQRVPPCGKTSTSLTSTGKVPFVSRGVRAGHSMLIARSMQYDKPAAMQTQPHVPPPQSLTEGLTAGVPTPSTKSYVLPCT